MDAVVKMEMFRQRQPDHVFDVSSAPNSQKMHLSFFFIAPVTTFSLSTSFSESMYMMGDFSKNTISFRVIVVFSRLLHFEPMYDCYKLKKSMCSFDAF